MMGHDIRPGASGPRAGPGAAALTQAGTGPVAEALTVSAKAKLNVQKACWSDFDLINITAYNGLDVQKIPSRTGFCWTGSP